MLIKLAWRNLWRNKLRTAIMLGAIVFGLVGVVAMMAFMTGLVNSMLDNAIAWQTSHIQIHNKAYVDNPDIKQRIVDSDRLIAQLDQQGNIAHYSQRFIANGMVASARSTRGVRINGINIEQEQSVTPLAQHIIQGEWLDSQGRNPVLVSEKTAQQLKLRVGSKVVLTFSDLNGEVAGAAFRVRGVFKTPSTAFDEGNIYVRQTDLTALAGGTGAHEIAIVVKQPDKLAETVHKLTAIAGDNNQVRDWQQVQPMLASMTNSMQTSNNIMLGIFVIAMGFGIVNIMLMSVFERSQELGVLLAVGMQKQKVFMLITLESALLGVCGSVIGIAVCLLLVGLFGRTGISLSALAEGLGTYGIDTLLYPQVDFDQYVTIFITVLCASIMAAFYPARQILKLRPAQAMAEKH
ncbi:ABC transporter permease [Vibrio brasiliensis]|uniref:ABC transporter permease n=1 Tax=Vibrio brasiliensis TaxID=170652 RepID=UPI001EFC2E2B|nr:ABC transporter permease [Vibrio brasiliensis]MCG9750502.1 ABC transporter permease [Vibrio brasiliensis]MCG9784112.1 ABC transporter permease [Vibrio brasiliensis]